MTTMNVAILHVLCFIIGGAVTQNLQQCSNPVINLPEVEKNTSLTAYDTTDNVTLTNESPPGYLEARGNHIYSAKRFSLDDDPNLCDKSSNTERDIRVTVSCSGQKVNLTIKIAGQNDFPPVLEPNHGTTSVRERIPALTEIYDLSNINITDEDCPSGIPRYLRTEDDNFKQEGKIISTKRVFDFENGDTQLVFTALVQDEDADPLKSNFTLTVNIEDVDDQTPTFNHSSYTLHVPERNDSLGGIWQTTDPPVYAYDQDLGINQPVLYSFLGAVIPTTPNPGLTINNSTGQVKVSGVLDREMVDTYTVILKVAQDDNPLQTATSTLTLSVNDVNDNRPLFRPVDYPVQIQEHSSVGSIVTIVTATDTDQGENAEFQYEILSHGDIFDVDPQTGYVTVKNDSMLDREVEPTFVIVVTTEETNPPWPGSYCNSSCNATVTVTLIDINDHSPVFNNYEYRFTAHNITGAEIGYVNATDADVGDNARIEYSLDDSTIFAIDATTGGITQTVLVGASEQVLLAQACDFGERRRCSSVKVVVSIPVGSVSSSNVTINVTENIPVGTSVYLLHKSFTGHGMALRPTSAPFTFSDTEVTPGVILTTGEIDRENASRHMLYIDGTDSVTITLFVNVLDQNDNSPKFNQSSYVFRIEDSANIGDDVGVVAAYDLDEGVNGNIDLRIEGDESSRQFSIESATGKITIQEIPHLAQEFTELFIVATDNGELPLKTSTVVKIYVGRIDGTVRFFAPASKDDVEKDREELISGMTGILEVNVNFDEVRSVTSPYGPSSAIYLSATHQAKRANVSEADLRTKVEENYDELMALFSKYQRVAAPEETTFTLPVIILIAVAAAILLVSVIIMALMYKRCRSYQRKARLVRHLTPKNTIYETQEIHHELDEEASAHSPTGSLSTRHLLQETQQPNGNAIAVENPGFNNNDDNNNDDNQDSVTQVTHVEDDGEETDEVVIDFDSSDDLQEQETGEVTQAQQGEVTPAQNTEEITYAQTSAEVVHADEDTIPDPDYANQGVIEVLEIDKVLESAENEAMSYQVTEDLDSTEPDVTYENEAISYQVTEDLDSTEPEHVYENELGTSPPPPPPPPPMDEEKDGDEDKAEDEEELPPPPPTPPRQRSTHLAETEEQTEESPEEPEPDYAKKVRFSEVKVNVIPDPEPEAEKPETDGEETEDEELNQHMPVETIKNPHHDISDEATFVMTSL